MFSVTNITKRYGDVDVLKGISFDVGVCQKVALVGSNGVGKTTLLSIIAGLEEPDSGKVSISSDALLGYLPQQIKVDVSCTIAEYLGDVTGYDQLVSEMSSIEMDLTKKPENAELLQQYGRLQEKFERIDGYDFDARAKATLGGLGLDDVDVQRRLSDLSSGQRSKVALAGVLLLGRDILLFDEPTNNLDMPALIWLEHFLRETSATVIIVSHDRRLLDKIADKVFEINWFSREIREFGGTYTNFLQEKEREFAHDLKGFDEHVAEVKRLRKAQTDKSVWAAKSAAGGAKRDNDKYLRGRQKDRAKGVARSSKALEKRILQKGEVDVPQKKERPDMTIDAPSRTGRNFLVDVQAAIVKLDKQFSLGPFDFEIKPKERIAIMGSNGVGKTTLLQVLAGKLKLSSGNMDVALNLQIGVFDQEHEILQRDLKVKDAFMELADVSSENAGYILSKLGLVGSGTLKKLVNQLSPGERARVILASFVARQTELLLLDEPTNHLDIEAAEELETALSSYDGALVVISHDRYFLEKVGFDRFVVVEDGLVRSIKNVSSYLQQIARKVRKFQYHAPNGK